ncbi:hypothetical protein AWU65_07100 [Paenibacillus glucanolyticus]|uniref:DUF2577 domain-containing protein n=1 Tax=Paenibacillus glucanolyticus TaxID=59843 RepID=A0A163HWB3_9BACL|nr:DUF2577 domain-containing protein [Paenibacillus glucanolyticus]KZS45695.1 hypothetical protein AWU65_07100 [Paenibacillus glucanolyticus]
MADLLNTLKKAAVSAVAAGNPTVVMFGTVSSADPLEVNVDQRFTLPADFLIVPESLIHFEIDFHHDHEYTDDTGTGSSTKKTESALPVKPIVIRRGLKVGDKLLMMRVQGGQKFIILDRVVDA